MFVLKGVKKPCGEGVFRQHGCLSQAERDFNMADGQREAILAV